MSPASPATASSPPTPPAYRPRHPERLPTYRQYLECGRLVGGFARIQCPNCRAEHLLAFSCRTRNLCTSCQAKRSVLFGERLVREVVAGVGHRHVVFTVPIAVRGVLERDRSLLGALARTAYEALSRVMGAAGEEGVAKEARPPRSAVPGMVASIQPFRSDIDGSYANFHPHIHAIVTKGTQTYITGHRVRTWAGVLFRGRGAPVGLVVQRDAEVDRDSQAPDADGLQDGSEETLPLGVIRSLPARDSSGGEAPETLGELS